MAEIYPECPAATRALCRRLYRDLLDARAMPRFYRRRAMRIDCLRDLFAGECRIYADQRARADAQAAMNGFINSLAADQLQRSANHPRPRSARATRSPATWLRPVLWVSS